MLLVAIIALPQLACAIEIHGIAAKVNGTAITEKQVAQHAAQQIQQFEKENKGRIPESHFNAEVLKIKRDTLQALLQATLLTEHLKKLDPDTQAKWLKSFHEKSEREQAQEFQRLIDASHVIITPRYQQPE